jgi:hypothetical protein
MNVVFMSRLIFETESVRIRSFKASSQRAFLDVQIGDVVHASFNGLLVRLKLTVLLYSTAESPLVLDNMSWWLCFRFSYRDLHSV